ncbi:MAG: YcgL domain-containing protein [Pseudomonadales bacterium]|nr:YcgL domain-containing protein [Pseudomonadales bacterium]MBO6565294.1 YcgL domain-containing protein [Pseudomonadales bacterium]MBO6595688.1 YcgL domain-containing protein [Pseudomonadales bacterium]MBO6657378.1 YcgL domain-containing protein [Pseudomonadales bacterium]MBO6702188.1 YcgL domain-containing protein [Pseudomonadales bacterium]
MECDVYKSVKRENYYLYVAAGEGLNRVPEALLKQFGEVEKALTFELTPERRLAREDAEQVISNLESQGYHLQLPPADDRFR